MLRGLSALPCMPMSMSPQQALTPSQLNTLARDLLEGAFPLVWIEGELSNVSRPASGHLYFTVKDARAQVRCALWRQRALLLRFRPADGQQVRLRARVTLYEPRGEYQLQVDWMEPAGEGALRLAFEALKARLEAEGLFDAGRKRPLPALPRRIALLTSPRGAAIHDVLSVLARRCPLLQVDVVPIPVQGDAAAAQIRAALDAVAAQGRHDLVLLTRGGGSLEDLQAFNDEALARRIAACPVPVVSAVGHEVDFSISDFVADLRAPTPSAAAELIAPDVQALSARVRGLHDRLQRAAERHRQRLEQRLDAALLRLQPRSPAARLARGGQRLAQLEARLQAARRRRLERARERLLRLQARLGAKHPGQRLALQAGRLGHLQARLRSALLRGVERCGQRVVLAARALQSVSPLATLGRGYALLMTENGHILRRAVDASPGDVLRARLADGSLQLRVVSRDPDAGA